MPMNEAEKDRFVYLALNEIRSGSINPLKAVAVLKHIADIADRITKDPDFISLLDEEIGKYGKEEKPTAMGYEISMGQRRTFDFSTCEDEQYNDLKAKEDEVKSKVKAREKFLQSLDKTMIDPDFGTEVKPPVCKYTTYPILKAVKQGIELPKSDLPF